MNQVSMSECREKYWEELSSEEKIEKLGNIIEKQERYIDHLGDRLNLFNEHDHINGKLVVPLNRNEPIKGYRDGGILNKNPHIDLKKEVI